MKKTVLNVILYLIFPILFNIIFFVLCGTDLPASVWLAYGWIHVAYLVFVFSPLFARKGFSEHLYKTVCWQIALAYFVLELIAGVVFIILRSGDYKLSLIVQCVLFGVFLIVFIINLIANDRTADSEERSKKEISLIKTSAARVKMLMNGENDPVVLKSLEHLYDEIHSSPAKSSEDVKLIECSILDKLDELETALEGGDKDTAKTLIKQLETAVYKRNRLLM